MNQIIDMIAGMAGPDTISAMAGRAGLSPEQVRSAMAALAPAVAGGLARTAQNGPDVLGQIAAQADTADPVAGGNAILGQIFGSKDVSRAVAGEAAGQTGLDAGALKALLPMVASLAAAAMAKSGGGMATGGLGGMLGSLLGGGGSAAGAPGGLGALAGMLDRNGDGNPLDDILKMMRR